MSETSHVLVHLDLGNNRPEALVWRLFGPSPMSQVLEQRYRIPERPNGEEFASLVGFLIMDASAASVILDRDLIHVGKDYSIMRLAVALNTYVGEFGQSIRVRVGDDGEWRLVNNNLPENEEWLATELGVQVRH